MDHVLVVHLSQDPAHFLSEGVHRLDGLSGSLSGCDVLAHRDRVSDLLQENAVGAEIDEVDDRSCDTYTDYCTDDLNILYT